MDRPERGSLTHDTAARLIGLTPAELESLVSAGAIRRNDKNAYAATALIQDYVAHIKTPRESEKLSQADIGTHLDISERSVRELLTEWAVDHRTTPLADIRVRYIRKLRESAAGRATAGDLVLAQERAALAREQRIRLELANTATRGEQAPIELLGDALSKSIEVMVAELDQIDGMLAQTAPDLPAAARRAVLSCITAARNKIAARGAQLVLGTIDPADDIDAGQEADAP